MQNKRGQFYLIAAVIIIAMVFAITALVNQAKKQEFTEIQYAGEELAIEAEAVLDYGIKNNKDMNILLGHFTKNYSDYSNVENLYFVFGDTPDISVAAYRHTLPAIIIVNISEEESDELEIPVKAYTKKDYSISGNVITLTINEIPYEFELKDGTNFYFITSESDEEQEYIITGSVIKEGEE